MLVYKFIYIILKYVLICVLKNERFVLFLFILFFYLSGLGFDAEVHHKDNKLGIIIILSEQNKLIHYFL